MCACFGPSLALNTFEKGNPTAAHTLSPSIHEAKHLSPVPGNNKRRPVRRIRLQELFGLLCCLKQRLSMMKGNNPVSNAVDYHHLHRTDPRNMIHTFVVVGYGPA